MSVKVIVTDMDGTFLNDAKTYNQPRFMAQYQELKKRGIKFVVASGNQYYQLISFFPELKDEISFVAENGALAVSYTHLDVYKRQRCRLKERLRTTAIFCWSCIKAIFRFSTASTSPALSSSLCGNGVPFFTVDTGGWRIACVAPGAIHSFGVKQ